MSKIKRSDDIYEKYTPAQREVILSHGKNMLVSASAGTGKTTVMIERIANLLRNKKVDVSQMVVVTFTKLAAAEMKNRLAVKLSEFAGELTVREQLERLDGASICTLHSFCSDLLRNYFYVVDIDPAFVILDTATVGALQKTALEKVFEEYFQKDDEQFKKLYKIFSTNRKEENFKSTLLKLYSFSRCIVDFPTWYEQNRKTFVEFSQDNAIVQILLQDISQRVRYLAKGYQSLTERAKEEPYMDAIAVALEANAQKLVDMDCQTLEQALFALGTTSLQGLPRRGAKALKEADKVIEEKLRTDNESLAEDFEKLKKSYSEFCQGKNMQTLWQEMGLSLAITDKLVEMVTKFDEQFYALKKQRGGVDFNDLEHLTLQLLADSQTLQSIREKYKMVFVDEYQDTNFVQEAIVSQLAHPDNLFMVGDVKQSIYGFRGCEPNIFVDKQKLYEGGDGGQLVKLNANFRSNREILRFVNTIFNSIMTAEFGKVDYVGTSKLEGERAPTLQTPSVRVDFLLKKEKEKREITEIYDITQQPTMDDGVTQANLIAKRIKEYVGMAYKGNDGNIRRIGYGDIVILMRGLTTKATDIYNTLVEKNIPVTANFKVEGYSSKEVREIINLLRAIDNPYNDVYLVGVCLSCFGGFLENDLAKIRLGTTGRITFCDRLKEYATNFDDQITAKITHLFALLDSLRFYSRGASVCEVCLKILQQTNFHLYVQGLPNGALRLRKLYTFIDSIKDVSFGQSIDKFLDYLDDSEDTRAEEALANTNAVRMMTMHASKGLEFPVVIIAGVESQFVFDELSVNQNAQLGIATKYYDFATMKKHQTLGMTACSLSNKLKQREEEMRLLYVAMTRPKFVLDIVGSVTQSQLDGIPKMPKVARSHLDWLLYALKSTYPNFAISSEQLTVEVVQNVLDSQAVSQDMLCAQYTDKNAVLDKIRYQYAFQNQTEMPSKMVSSQLDKIYLDLEEEEKPIPVIVEDDKNKIGTAYHAVYQFVDYNANVAQIEQTIKALVAECRIEEQFASQLDVNLIYNTLQNPLLQKIVASGKVYHEVPFMLYAPYDQLAKDKRFGDNVILQGVIDLLVLEDNKATVVDFKYTSRSDKVHERYQYQLNSYRMAVQQICGIANVDCYVLSIADNKFIKM